MLLIYDFNEKDNNMWESYIFFYFLPLQTASEFDQENSHNPIQQTKSRHHGEETQNTNRRTALRTNN